MAKDLVGAYPYGVWLVELASLSDPALVPSVVAAALGVREWPDLPLTATLVDSLGSTDDTKLTQLTFNTGQDTAPVLSPDGQKIAYVSNGAQTSSPEGDFEVYIMNALDDSNQKNLTNTNSLIGDLYPAWEVKKKN